MRKFRRQKARELAPKPLPKTASPDVTFKQYLAAEFEDQINILGALIYALTLEEYCKVTITIKHMINVAQYASQAHPFIKEIAGHTEPADLDQPFVVVFILAAHHLGWLLNPEELLGTKEPLLPGQKLEELLKNERS